MIIVAYYIKNVKKPSFFEKDGLDAYWVEVTLKTDPTKYHCFCPCIEDGFIPR